MKEGMKKEESKRKLLGARRPLGAPGLTTRSDRTLLEAFSRARVKKKAKGSRRELLLRCVQFPRLLVGWHGCKAAMQEIHGLLASGAFDRLRLKNNVLLMYTFQALL